jgi:uncharacterized membrane protein YphA (DoxX/SURF4 family)
VGTRRVCNEAPGDASAAGCGQDRLVGALARLATAASVRCYTKLVLEPLVDVVARARRHVTWHRLIAVLRLMIGFAFVPAGLKKLTGQPFTDPTNHGPFHDFLHAFHATGWFYNFVGVVQLVIAALLMTQAWAPLGAVLAVPVLVTIAAFCWSTAVVPTAIVVSLMLLGALALVAWELPRLRRALLPDPTSNPNPTPSPSPSPNPNPNPSPSPSPNPNPNRFEPLVSTRIWAACGVAIIVLYVALCLWQGEVYRPRKPSPHEPGFWVMPAIALLPVVAWLADRRAARARAARTGYGP